MLGELFTLLITSVLINNVVLNQFLGICPFMGVSKKASSAIGMGLAVVFVIVAASIVTFGLYYLVLVPLQIQYMDLITFILVIASLVQLTEMFIKKTSPLLYQSLGVYLPLITTNCVSFLPFVNDWMPVMCRSRSRAIRSPLSLPVSWRSPLADWQVSYDECTVDCDGSSLLCAAGRYLCGFVLSESQNAETAGM